MSSGDNKLAERLLASLKRYNPAKVRAYAGDDDTRDIAVPTRRRKWAQVISAIEARAWSRVELLDKSGAVLGYVDNDEPAGELVELGAPQSKSITEARAIVELVLRGMREVLTFRDKETTALLEAQGSVVREMREGMHAVTLIYKAQTEAAHELATAQAEAAGGGSQLKELMEAAPTLLPMIPMLRQLFSGDKPAAAPNGARKAT